jgi:hypothetical protein
VTEGDGVFDGGARLDYALVPLSAWQAGVGIPGFVRILSSHLRSPYTGDVGHSKATAVPLILPSS